jgi:hypothetical protein
MYASGATRPFQQSPTEYQYNLNNPPWQKLLWVKQNYPDNYVDSTFLDELQRNGNLQSTFFLIQSRSLTIFV